MSTRFHTPTAPPAAIRPPRTTNRAGIYFLYKHHPGGCFSCMEKSGHNRSGEEEAGQGGGPLEGWGKRREEGRAFSSRKRGKKENTNFLCRQFSMSTPEEQKISSLSPIHTANPHLCLQRHFSLPLTALNITKSLSWPWSLVPCGVQGAVGAALPAQLKLNHPNLHVLHHNCAF